MRLLLLTLLLPLFFSLAAGQGDLESANVAGQTNFTKTAIASSSPSQSWDVYQFEKYYEGDVIELANSSFVLGESDFTFVAWLKPSRLDYGMIASKDRSGESEEQLRLELHQSGKICLMGLGTRSDPHATATQDPSGWASDLVSAQPIPVGRMTHIALVRKGLQIILYIDGEVSCVVRTSRIVNHRALSRYFRVGSRYPPAGDGAGDPFPGKITNAMLILGALKQYDVKRVMAGLLPPGLKQELVSITTCDVSPNLQSPNSEHFLIDLNSADTWEHVGYLLKLVHGDTSVSIPKLIKEGSLSAAKPWKSVSDRVVPPDVNESQDFTILYNNGSLLTGRIWKKSI